MLVGPTTFLISVLDSLINLIEFEPKLVNEIKVNPTINKNTTPNFIMTYSYGRALQQSALKHWSKNIKDIKGTQKIFNHRAEMCSLASQGKWSNELENK